MGISFLSHPSTNNLSMMILEQSLQLGCCSFLATDSKSAVSCMGNQILSRTLGCMMLQLVGLYSDLSDDITFNLFLGHMM